MQDELPGLLSGQKVVDGDLTDDGPVLDERHVLTGLKGGKTLYWRPSTTPRLVDAVAEGENCRVAYDGLARRCPR